MATDQAGQAGLGCGGGRARAGERRAHSTGDAHWRVSTQGLSGRCSTPSAACALAGRRLPASSAAAAQARPSSSSTRPSQGSSSVWARGPAWRRAGPATFPFDASAPASRPTRAAAERRAPPARPTCHPDPGVCRTPLGLPLAASHRPPHTHRSCEQGCPPTHHEQGGPQLTSTRARPAQGAAHVSWTASKCRVWAPLSRTPDEPASWSVYCALAVPSRPVPRSPDPLPSALCPLPSSVPAPCQVPSRRSGYPMSLPRQTPAQRCVYVRYKHMQWRRGWGWGSVRRGQRRSPRHGLGMRKTRPRVRHL